MLPTTANKNNIDFSGPTFRAVVKTKTGKHCFLSGNTAKV